MERRRYMLTWYFYSVPTSVIPSPYFKSVNAVYAHLSKAGIFQFTIWAGTHEAPYPVTMQSFHQVIEEEV
jgi:hypothetical protein